ncbi:hypothetical protein HPB49_010348 [Dermacentor silvarum]|uniref:Uncharacterized protein n=1 Tax=Dermacentor silvarum TaxID=543639 RepID=A0ACB8C304_DERSI|nr:hypothetical protein HPB49_010348 [Dermacentor silvarum]
MAHPTFRRSKLSFFKSSRAGVATGKTHEERRRPRLLSTIQSRETLALRLRLLKLHRRLLHQSPCGRQSQRSGQHKNAITISPNWEQNIIVCGTQNPAVVQKLLNDFQRNTGRGPLPLHGHLKLTSDVFCGVISVHNPETNESLKHSVQWRGGERIHVRKLENSNLAVLTFEGRNVPRYVHYHAELTSIREYKKTVPACYRCGTLGHRADNCHNPAKERCGLCGQNVGAGTEGMAPHECNTTCIVCGGPHLTGSRECTGKFIRLQQPGPRTSGPPATSRC